MTLRMWAKELSGKTERIWCDNNTSEMSLFSGKTKNNFKGACLREVWRIVSTNDIFLSCEHIAGEENNQADLLSRAFVSKKGWLDFENFAVTGRL